MLGINKYTGWLSYDEYDCRSLGMGCVLFCGHVIMMLHQHRVHNHVTCNCCRMYRQNMDVLSRNPQTYSVHNSSTVYHGCCQLMLPIFQEGSYSYMVYVLYGFSRVFRQWLLAWRRPAMTLEERMSLVI